MAPRQNGFSVILLLALLVMLSGLLAYGATLTASLHSSGAQEMALGRATQAARSGLQWGRWRALNGNNCAASTTLTLPTSAPQTVTVLCVRYGPYLEGSGPVQRYRYQLKAIACSPAGAGGCPNAAQPADYVQQQATGWAETP